MTDNKAKKRTNMDLEEKKFYENLRLVLCKFFPKYV